MKNFVSVGKLWKYFIRSSCMISLGSMFQYIEGVKRKISYCTPLFNKISIILINFTIYYDTQKESPIDIQTSSKVTLNY